MQRSWSRWSCSPGRPSTPRRKRLWRCSRLWCWKPVWGAESAAVQASGVSANAHPLHHRRDGHHRQNAARYLLVVAGGYVTEWPESIDHALADRSLTISLVFVGLRSGFVAAIRNDRVDLAGRRPVAQFCTAVAFVAGERPRSHPLRHAPQWGAARGHWCHWPTVRATTTGLPWRSRSGARGCSHALEWCP